MVFDAETNDKVKKQVEFYFSDSNLPRDAFLKEKVAADPEGFVDLALVCIFSRMCQLLKTTNKDPSKVPSEKVVEVAEALDGSTVLTLSEDKKRVRRAEPLRSPEEVTKEVDVRSLYALPFPFDATLDALTEFFGKAGSVNCVRMRRHLTSKDFKGSVFVEFASKEEAEKVATMSLEFEGAPIKMEPKLDYIKRKEQERHEKPNSPYQKSNAAEAVAVPEGDANGTAAGNEGERDEEGAAAVPEFTPGCLLHFIFGEDEEVGPTVTFGTIKDSFGGKEGGVGFVDYQKGNKSGYVRFQAPDQAQEVVSKLEEGNSMMVAGQKATVRLLEGDEETQYVSKAQKDREAAKKTAGRGKGGRGGRGGRGGFRGRGGGRGRGQKRQRGE